MHMKALLTFAGLVAAAVIGLPDRGEAQAWSEANSPGFFGGYGHFGGYYDTFGEYGGHSSYNGYVRTEGGHRGTVTLLTVPLSRRTPTRTHLAHARCEDVKRHARNTGRAVRSCGHIEATEQRTIRRAHHPLRVSRDLRRS